MLESLATQLPSLIQGSQGMPGMESLTGQGSPGETSSATSGGTFSGGTFSVLGQSGSSSVWLILLGLGLAWLMFGGKK